MTTTSRVAGADLEAVRALGREALADAAARADGRDDDGAERRILAIAGALGRLGWSIDDRTLEAGRALTEADRRTLLEEAAILTPLLGARLEPAFGATWRERRGARRALRRLRRAVATLEGS